MPPPDIQIHVKGLSLGAELKDTDGRSSLRLSYEFGASSTDDEDDEESDDENEPSTVIKEVILGSLTPGKVNHVFPYFGCDMTPPIQIEQAALDLVLDEKDEYIFEVIGKKCNSCPLSKSDPDVTMEL